MDETRAKEFSDTVVRSYERHMISAGMSKEQTAIIHIKVAADIIKWMIAPNS